jgi:hypothetical protein
LSPYVSVPKNVSNCLQQNSEKARSHQWRPETTSISFFGVPNIFQLCLFFSTRLDESGPGARGRLLSFDHRPRGRKRIKILLTCPEDNRLEDMFTCNLSLELKVRRSGLTFERNGVENHLNYSWKFYSSQIEPNQRLSEQWSCQTTALNSKWS